MSHYGTWRVGDGSQVRFADAVVDWITAAIPVLEGVARTYHATTTYLDLGEQVQERSGIWTRMLLMNWIGPVLAGASRASHSRGQPLLSALCVRTNGMIGEGYECREPLHDTG